MTDLNTLIRSGITLLILVIGGGVRRDGIE
jgi:hypothetical protein